LSLEDLQSIVDSTYILGNIDSVCKTLSTYTL